MSTVFPKSGATVRLPIHAPQKTAEKKEKTYASLIVSVEHGEEKKARKRPVYKILSGRCHRMMRNSPAESGKQFIGKYQEYPCSH